jgi:hypothetical protein
VKERDVITCPVKYITANGGYNTFEFIEDELPGFSPVDLREALLKFD